eukprot:SAG31_NODE_1080_length_10027_cov_8.417204_5_plen_153_part_00
MAGAEAAVDLETVAVDAGAAKSGKKRRTFAVPHRAFKKEHQYLKCKDHPLSKQGLEHAAEQYFMVQAGASIDEPGPKTLVDHALTPAHVLSKQHGHTPHACIHDAAMFFEGANFQMIMMVLLLVDVLAGTLSGLLCSASCRLTSANKQSAAP